jgi:hypothetical protein
MFAANNRYRAGLIHFGLSTLVVGAAFLAVYFLWYPEPLFEGAGGRHLFVVLACVDITIGPLITLIIYKPGKPGLKFDLAVIGMLQLAALAYGTHVVFEARPVWLVFTKDRFDLVRANQISDAERLKARPQFQQLSLDGPRMAGARTPTDPDERFRIMMTALSGIDVSSYPQHYVPYEEMRAEAASKAKGMRELRALNPGSDPRIDRLLAQLGRKDADVSFLPVRAGRKDLTALIDARTGDFLELTLLKPWKY